MDDTNIYFTCCWVQCSSTNDWTNNIVQNIKTMILPVVGCSAQAPAGPPCSQMGGRPSQIPMICSLLILAFL